MKRTILAIAMLWGVTACTADEASVEEPVELTPEPPLTDQPHPIDADEEAEAGNAADESADDFGGAEMDGSAGDATEEAPMAAPAPKPPGAATGGIISSGTNAKPQERCNALESAAERKKCLLKLKRKGR